MASNITCSVFIYSNWLDTVRNVLQVEPQGHLATKSFRMRIFPRREIVSDMIRFSRLPFCGMRPFMRLVERVAAGERHSLLW